MGRHFWGEARGRCIRTYRVGDCILIAMKGLA